MQSLNVIDQHVTQNRTRQHANTLNDSSWQFTDITQSTLRAGLDGPSLKAA